MIKQKRNRVVALAAMLSPVVYAQTAAVEPPQSSGALDALGEDVVILSPFEVSSDSDKGYVATHTLAGSRINSRLEDLGSAITVVTAEFLKDTGAVDNKSLLQYTPNTEVGGMQGNFRGASGGQTEDEGGKFVNPNQNTRVRGLSSADNTRNFFTTNIPWDGYNTERVDMQRGANSILFGMGSPAGIINTTSKTAQHRTFGSLELRYGSYGANRQVIDHNQNILKDELSVRVSLLRKDEQYQQDPAYSLDRRIYGTLRYDPKFLSRGGAKTTVKVNYENGSIRSNNPRTLAPIDSLTTWWDKVGQAVYNPNLVQNSGEFFQLGPDGQPQYDADGDQIGSYYPDNAGQYNKTRTPGNVTNPNYQAWLGAPSFYGGVWLQYNPGEASAYSTSMPEFKNIGGINSAGTIDGGIGLPFSRRVSMATSQYWAEREAKAPYQKWGLWKQTSLTDPSVYDFYNHLIDGDNKNEWQNFHTVNASLTQTFFNQKLGFEAAYDNQRYRSGQYSFSNGAIYVDINSHQLDGTPNQNVGKAYIESSNTWGNSATDVTRESSRLSAYFTHDFNEGRRGSWVAKLLGKHTFSGLYSVDMWRSDYRGFKRYGTTDEFASLVSTANDRFNIDNNERAVSTTIYLSDSLLGASTYKGLEIPNAGAKVAISPTVDWSYFNSTWSATGVDPAAEWINPYNNAVSTQSENPSNYVGWSTTPVTILSAEDGDQDDLTFSASLNRRKTDSRAIVWQGGFWDGAITGMYGIRADNVKVWGTAGTKVNNRVDFGAVDAESKLVYSTTNRPPAMVHEANSPSWSVMAKLNKFFGKHGDRFPVNVSLYYNESENFQIESARQDLYGNQLPMPSGTTNERGVMLSTRDGKYFVRINKYETAVKDATNTTGIPTWFFTGNGNFIMRNEDRADAYEYRLTELGNPDSVADTGSVTGNWAWEWSPVGDQTQAEADALSASVVAAWRQYTADPIVQKILQAWGFNDFGVTQLTKMSTPVNNFVPTEDQLSKGWEYEFVANPTKNWSISVNASETKAMRTNIGGELLQEFVALTNEYQNGPMGLMRQWGGGGASSTGQLSWNSNFYSKYLLMKLQEGTYSTELRRWRFNVVTNYRFDEGRLKGWRIGGGFRWQDKVAIGFPLIDVNGDGSEITYDLDKPYYGPSQSSFDFWIGYSRKLTAKIDWDIQLNVYNVGKGNKLIPISTQYDGTPATWSIAPHQSWALSSTFKF